jgi:hypothetical protein
MTSNAPPSTPIEWLGAMLVRLVMDFSGRLSWGGITPPVLDLVFRRITDNKRRIDRIVAQIHAAAPNNPKPNL